jgi:hypothetical protein
LKSYEYPGNRYRYTWYEIKNGKGTGIRYFATGSLRCIPVPVPGIDLGHSFIIQGLPVFFQQQKKHFRPIFYRINVFSDYTIMGSKIYTSSS